LLIYEARLVSGNLVLYTFDTFNLFRFIHRFLKSNSGVEKIIKKKKRNEILTFFKLFCPKKISANEALWRKHETG